MKTDEMEKERDLNPYEALSREELILCAFAGSEAEKVSFYSLLKRCLSLFPAKFCFEERPEWPDARKLGRPLRSLRGEGLVEGDPNRGFSLTEAGKGKAGRVRKRLRQRRLKFED